MASSAQRARCAAAFALANILLALKFQCIVHEPVTSVADPWSLVETGGTAAITRDRDSSCNVDSLAAQGARRWVFECVKNSADRDPALTGALSAITIESPVPKPSVDGDGIVVDLQVDVRDGNSTGRAEDDVEAFSARGAVFDGVGNSIWNVLRITVAETLAALKVGLARRG